MIIKVQLILVIICHLNFVKTIVRFQNSSLRLKERLSKRYYIELRIERVKEFIRYDELTLTQIALRMNYSSVAYLSSQFKSVTGMTPSQFKGMKDNLRTSLDKL